MTRGTEIEYGRLRDALAAEGRSGLLSGLIIFAVPHWLDDELAVSLWEWITPNDSSASEVIARVKHFPFVAPYEGRGWRVIEPARTFFMEAAPPGSQVITRVDAFLAEWFSRRKNGTATAAGRELHWRFAYHAAPSDPGRAVEAVLAVVSSSDAEGADLAGSVQLFDERSAYLSSYRVEANFVAGMLAYRRRQYPTASIAFRQVVEGGGKDRRILHIAQHLLGLILSRPPGARLDEAIPLIEDAYANAASIGDETGLDLIAPTLASVLAQRGRYEDYGRANEVLRDQIDADRPTLKLVPSLHQRARALVHLGSEYWDEAELLLRRALELAASDDFTARNSIHLTLSELAEMRGDLDLAIAEMEDKRRIDVESGREDRVALDDARIARLRRHQQGS